MCSTSSGRWSPWERATDVRVLLAEDDALSRLMLERDLTKLGYEVSVAENGRDAWDQFSARRFPLVVTDWMMPEMSGLDLIRRIRASQSDEYAYVILLTSRSEHTDLIDGMEAGADDFITKPFQPDELRVRLRAGNRVIDLEHALVKRKQEIESAHDRMRSDLEAAAQVQRAYLPVQVPDRQGARFAWAFRPCDQLAGDMLNVVTLDDTHVGFYLLDVSGHGVPSALLSVALTRLMTPDWETTSVLCEPSASAPGFQIVSPAEVANRLNRRLLGDGGMGQYVTMIYGLLDTSTRTCRLIAAGHPPPARVGSGAAPALLDVSGFPIGLTELSLAKGYVEVVVQFEAGERLYLYSDGVTEASNEAGDEFGTDRLLNVLAETRSLPIAESVDALTQRLEAWQAGKPADDDVSILAVEFGA